MGSDSGVSLMLREAGARKGLRRKAICPGRPGDVVDVLAHSCVSKSMASCLELRIPGAMRGRSGDSWAAPACPRLLWGAGTLGVAAVGVLTED